METARVFTTGRSQAVRLPKEYRFDVDEVYINRVGDAVILTPVNRLGAVFDAALSGFTDDFLAEGRPGEIPTEDRASL